MASDTALLQMTDNVSHTPGRQHLQIKFLLVVWFLIWQTRADNTLVYLEDKTSFLSLCLHGEKKPSWKLISM